MAVYTRSNVWRNWCPREGPALWCVSKQGLVNLASGRAVTIEYEKRDRYKRIVGKILVNPPGDVFCLALDCVKKIDAGLEQIKAGLACKWEMLSERGVLLRPEANELRTGFADHTQNEAGTEQVQPRDQEVSKQRTDNFKQESQNKNTQGKYDETTERIQRDI